MQPPKRPDYGTKGRLIALRANFLCLNTSPELSDLYHYDVEITPDKCPKEIKRDIVNEAIKKYKNTVFQGHHPAFDGERNLYSRIELPVRVKLNVQLPGGDGGRDRHLEVRIQFAGSVSLLELNNFLSGKQDVKRPHGTVQALNTVVRQMPSLSNTSVGKLLFPIGGQGRFLGEGCERKFGFTLSVRPSGWKAMLVNIDVSAKGFYKELAVVPDFLYDTLGLKLNNLKDCKYEVDRGKLEKVICGLRIQTTHAASIKRKYRVWGVSAKSAERMQFDVTDEGTGRTYKTTVAEYFKDRHKVTLRYPHLPCLRVGQKKGTYLPLEVCTVIPCERKHLSEQQITNMIRSTARPAPEQQRDIQHWAQEMTRESNEYLRNEFQTSLNSEMVKVEGHVLPAPRINLGPQDLPLVPRDGSWDMRNKSLHDGARIDQWALACFDRGCREEQLRNFSGQMANVSSRQGLRMSEQPVVVAYGRGIRDVESLFSKWVVDFPGLQLIMAVLPERDKQIYPELKRVGDNVIGIPTQGVQSKNVYSCKPHLCANLALKINSKLGGINHVIAAVVASMDANATKYYARVRAQNHRNGKAAQEIINDLAAMVRELLIEFYKANRKLKPSKIIFYRDGVSEGKFDQVLVHEVRAVQQACMDLEKAYRPRITFVVVQKRHHTRLYCENQRDEVGKARNVPPGTTVDSGITHPYEFDFYLCSHNGIQGTSRPKHYHVLYDDNSFTADALQQLTYQLCHLYARSTRSVSMPAPAYFAHLVAFRARHHVTGNGSVDLENTTKAIEVNAKMKGAMYFT
ncbi:protein argonaute-2-like [Stylophora pistillata]|uniref:protein argonaute-2-like n=1 Tax=Stylophora pistillata TaxID=50429 RepID=UPI000C053803|nr:protein argonaute-2-like [Stylophora pistillata]